MLKIVLLQTPSAELNGVPVVFPYKRADALLYYMMVRRSATRQELIALLWESCDEATGLKNLRNTLYTLKKVLGGEFLVSPQKSLVMVNPQWPLDCDYDRFTRDGEFSAYGGPFLQGFAVKQAFSYDEWVSRTREKLHAQYLRQLEEKARAALESGEQERAADWASEYLREDPFDEPMSAFLMERWRETKKYAKSAQVYQRLKQRLSEELGVDPQESTTMLYYEIMNQWNDAAMAGDGQPDDPVPVGREAACAALRAAADSFSEGAVRRCSQLLVGEVGAGKSELINHFLRTGALSSMLVLRCGCLQSEEQFPLAVWDRLMLPLLEVTQGEGVPLPVQIRARLGRAFSVFREGGAPLDGEGDRALRRVDQGLEDSVLLLMAAIARRKKVLLILEDLQWMDGESLRLAEAMLRRMEGGGLMTILTCRNDCGPMVREVLDRAEADGLLRVQRLQPLSLEQTEELLRRELGETVAGQLSGQFYRETGGNPYLLIELTQAYRRSEDVEATLHALGDILMERVSGLREGSIRVAELISVFQEEAPCSILLELLERNDRLLTDGLEELRSRGLIEERRTERESTCRFTHQRIRELVYDRLTDFQRRPLHLRVAELLSGGEQPQESAVCHRISRHFYLAGDELRALEYQILALDLDSARSCEPFAIQGGEHPLHLPPEQMEETAQQCLRALSALRGQHGDPAALTRLERILTLIRGRVALFQGNTDRGISILGGLSGSSVGRDDGVLVRACYLLAETSLLLQSASLAERYTATGMRLLERTKDPIQQAQFQRLRGSCFCLRGDYEKSSYYLLEAIDELEKQSSSTGAMLQLAASYCDYGRVCRQQQNSSQACFYYKKTLKLMGNEPWPGLVWVYVHYGRAAFALEDHGKARELFLRGYETAQTTGELWGRTAAAAFTAYYQAQDGEYDRAAHSLSDAQTSAPHLNAPLEGVILCFVSMHIRHWLDLDQRRDTPLEQFLPMPVDSYARQGIRLLSGVPDVFEAELLSNSLRDGIAAQQRFRASELYSKNKHFMTE